MRYRVTHTTRYAGPEPVSVGHNQAWLRPRELPTQRCRHYELRIDPKPSVQSTRRDYFGNTVAQFSFNQGYDALAVTAVSEIELQPRTLPNVTSDAFTWETLAATLTQHATDDDLLACEFTFDSPHVRRSAEFAAYARESFAPGRMFVDALTDLLARVHRDFQYDPTATTVSTPVAQVFADRHGVCQDFAHLMLSMLRSIGLAGRYLSGYLRTYPPPGQPRLVGADASHAWLAVYGGPLGWIDVDPTNNAFCDQEHITLAWGRDYSDVAPIKGVVIGGMQHHLTVSVDVLPLEDAGSE